MSQPKITVKRNNKEHNEFKLTAILTAGQILAIRHALENHPTPLGMEVFQYLKDATTVDGKDILNLS